MRVQFRTRKYQKFPMDLVVFDDMAFITPAIAAIPVAAVKN